MSYSYDSKKKQAMPAMGNDISESVQQSFAAMQNVDIHSGRRLDLESSLKSRIEQNTGFKMDNVELRESSDAAEMDAKAFAKGNVVHFAPGQFRPDTQEGQHLIEHELTHVAQQARGGVKADVEGLNVNASEHFESQADSGMGFSGGALQSLPTMNAEAAPIQGLFGGIKRFFKNAKDSIKIAYGFGKKAKEKDDVVRAINAEHRTETDDMVAAMKSSGFSDEEIEAQKLFQRVNMQGRREERYQDKLDAMIGYGGAHDICESEMDNFWARLARGVVRKDNRDSIQKEIYNFEQNVLVGKEEDAYALQLAESMSKKAAIRENNKNLAGGVLDGLKDRVDNGNALFKKAAARYDKRQGKQTPTDWTGEGFGNKVNEVRFLRRHITGDEAIDDHMFDSFLNGDTEAMEPYIKQVISNSMEKMNPDLISPDAEDSVFLKNADEQINLGRDVMAVSDMLKGGAHKKFNIPDEIYEQFKKGHHAHATNVGLASLRLKRLAGRGYRE